MNSKLISLVVGLSLCGAAVAKNNTDAIYEKDFGQEWAFTFDRGVLICYPKEAIFIVNPFTEEAYPLNGMADIYMSIGKVKASPLDSVWKDDPEYPGTKISVAPFIDLGSKLCG
ncbi:DUF2511 domain-containing protein [Yersinia sp. 2540 StPb PI]|uniref:DUF2511 domain-containing protein n=1 Tax=Yersinia sp. 2540 StPb PI TaxID=3117406 RepID=UPI003FA4561B